MGKGDRKSRKGKIFMGSYGVSRPTRKRKVKVVAAAIPVAAPAAAPEKKKAAPKKKAASAKKKEAEG